MSRRRIVLLGQRKGVAAMPPTAASTTSLTRNPKYIPPQGDRCPVEELLPPEVLAHIFEIGTRAEEDEDGWDVVEEDDGDEAYEDVDSDDESDYDEYADQGSMRLGKVRITEDAEDEEENSTERTRSLPFQVRMSHVCRRWRQVAITTSVLWARLSFSEPAPFDKSKEWISRSKLCPLDLTIDVTLPDESSLLAAELDVLESTQDQAAAGDGRHLGGGLDAEESLSRTAMRDIARILELAIPHVSRWRTFELSVSDYEHMHLALKWLAQCSADPGAPLLETLSLYCHEDSEDTEFEHFVFDDIEDRYLPFGGNVPKLALVGLWGVHLDWNMFIPPLERSTTSLQIIPSVSTSLTGLELAYHAKDVRPSYSDFANILRCATKLSSLEISCSGPALPPAGHTPEPLFLPTLRSLRLAFLEEDHASFLLRQLYAPGLTRISLDFDESDFTEFIDRLTSPMPIPLSPPPHFKELIRLPPDPSASPDSRMVDPSKPASILANVTDVKLSGLPCADTTAGLLYAACPRLRHLYLNMHFLPLTFFTLLMEQTEITRTTVRGRAVEAARIVMPDGPRGTLVCTRLEALTVSGMNGDALVTLVKTRKALGAPLRELNIDEMDTVTASDLRWLETNVEDVHLIEISDDEGESDEDSEDEDEDEVDEGHFN